MFCIAAFIVLLIMSAVSAKYRGYLKKAWGCTLRRMTLRPCDTSFKEEAKGRMLAPIAIKFPKWLKAADIGLEIASALVIVLTVWSLLVVAKSGLNLYVYGTCNPANAASCSLGAEACSIDSAKIGFVDAVTQLKIGEWISNEWTSLSTTVAAVPTRMQTWDATKYLSDTSTYLKPFEQDKPTAIEIIDPGCIVCQNLYRNIEASNFADRYNLTYIPYPIPNPDGTYRFPHSKLVTQYLEAVKLHPLSSTEVPVDWQIIDKLFTGTDAQGSNYQFKLNTVMDREQAIDLLDSWLAEGGYTPEQIKQIKDTAASDKVKEIMAKNSQVVREQIKTVKIPTIIFDGRRHDGLVEVEDLQ
jgi:hypothetical protein